MNSSILLLQPHHIARFFDPGKEICPICHHAAPLVDHVAAPIVGFDSVAGVVGQGEFGQFAGEVGLFSHLIAEVAAKALQTGRRSVHAIYRAGALGFNLDLVNPAHGDA